MSLVFECKYCPDTFPNFKKLVKHYETCHNQQGEQYKKLRESRTYRGTDSGCQQATDELGHQSSCLNCPFRKCKLDEPGVGPTRAKKRKRNDKILKLREQGKKPNEIAPVFHISLRQAQRILKDAKTR